MEDYRLIPLCGKPGAGKHVIVDAADYELLSQYKWYLHVNYARATISPRNRQFLHRFLLRAPEEKMVDHANGNPLDNRRCNLRFCSAKDNTRNRKNNFKGASKFKGVNLDGLNKLWVAEIRVNNKKLYLGHYESESEAARVYDSAARCYFGKFARPNFPAETTVSSMEEIRARREQLRLSKTSSGIRGVYWNVKQKKWVSWIRIDRKTVQIGTFKRKEDAITARKAALEKLS